MHHTPLARDLENSRPHLPGIVRACPHLRPAFPHPRVVFYKNKYFPCGPSPPPSHSPLARRLRWMSPHAGRDTPSPINRHAKVAAIFARPADHGPLRPVRSHCSASIPRPHVRPPRGTPRLCPISALGADARAHALESAARARSHRKGGRKRKETHPRATRASWQKPAPVPGSIAPNAEYSAVSASVAARARRRAAPRSAPRRAAPSPRSGGHDRAARPAGRRRP